MAMKPKQVAIDALWKQNPIFLQVLGICSTLAVTNLMANTLLMCFGLIFTTTLSSFFVSVLRNYIPQRIRMIVQVLIIAVFVMIVDIIIRAFTPDIHRFIGPYVGLIITNCIVMGRLEAFASQNRPLLATWDGAMQGVGYSLVLIVIALVREPLGFGTLMGYKLPALDLWWHQWTIMVMAPGAFFMLAILTWWARAHLAVPTKGKV
ncbi:MAG: NADH:ubiquinone reductase (Na(+)-transporting) subunit D [Chitinispirillaceae bacterium]|nr:NADH:ubiquinone reductase (Na(+)-transporting) subunit D [Chitinispirillaceae bacterium]